MNTIYEDKSASQKFGQVIKALRKKRQFTQEDLSEKSDIGVQYISRIENGAANPTLKVIRVIAIALDAALPELFSGLEKNND
ncbi:MAG: helix-turn-helix transcriptional regulator [Mailhella sp.]|nr:helix-turn-helix transcriptional regulator [Mailhella sp.]